MKSLIFGGEAVVTGKNSLEYLKRFNNKRVFIVTGGRSMTSNGTIKKISDMLLENSNEIYIHSGVKANPDTEDVTSALDILKDFKADIILAVGGGSPLDVGKLLAVLYECPDINMDNILKKILPEKRYKTILIAIPSTSGTGSEVSKASVITFKKQNIKIGLKCGGLVPDIAILDPEITLSMPDKVTAETGMDALTHAVESYINKNSDDFTQCLAKGAVEGIFRYLPSSYKEKTIHSRERMHNFQCMAAMSFANSGLGMAHGISHAIGGKFGLGHGLSNAIALPYVLKYNSKDKDVNDKLSELAGAIGSSSFVDEVINLNKVLSIPVSFKEAGIAEADFFDDFEKLVDNSMLGSTLVNPVKITRDEMHELLHEIYLG